MSTTWYEYSALHFTQATVHICLRKEHLFILALSNQVADSREFGVQAPDTNYAQWNSFVHVSLRTCTCMTQPINSILYQPLPPTWVCTENM